MEVLLSGKTSFKIEVPYRLYETGPAMEKPLILYLHGFGQNIKVFERITKPLLSLNAYHLFIQGPYTDLGSIQKNKRSGYGWYLYDGTQELFTKSLEYTSEFIQEVVDGLLPHLQVNRMALFGYSMGGYLAGYFGLSRWKHVNDMILVGCRIKTELFETGWDNRKHIKILGLHGLNDRSVKPDPQRKAIKYLRSKGLDAEFKGLDAGHKLSNNFITYSRKWFMSKGYKEEHNVVED